MQKRRPRAPREESEDEASASEIEHGDAADAEGGGLQDDVLAKNLIRYALACEHQRLPITRVGIREKGA